jgi:acetyl coenzyme A synthetase (ADP forming)-like protein
MAAGVRDVILRDGSTLRLRPPTAADAEALVAFFAGLSERSRYLRFHGLPRVGRALVEPFLEPDWEERGALAGTLTDEAGVERVVALATWTRLRDSAAAEVAFAVADPLQGRGVGTRLLEQLAETAAEAGVERFVAEVVADNRPMLAVFAEAGFAVHRELEGGTVEVTFAIEPTEHYRELVAERDHVAVTASLRPFFEPRSVAVLGASTRRGSIGGELFRNILAGDFAGAAYPVNRSGDPVAGVRGYRSIEEIPDAVDLAVVCLPAESVLEAAEQALRSGVKALVVISAGFAETGSEGLERQERLLALVRAHGARLIGPNCLGVSVAASRLNATFAPRSFPAGRLAFSSQSGALGLALLEEGEKRGLGLSAFVSIGNKADVSTNDLLEWWEDDPGTDAVLLYVESFGNPRKFARLARRVARRKPILAVKSGRTGAGARAARSHTAALAGSEAAVDALFRQAGVIRAGTLAELLDVAELLATQPLPHGRRVAVLTNAGGLGILCADACSVAGLELPPLGNDATAALAELLPAEASVVNPVDMLGGATAETYEAALGILLRDPGVDAVIVLFVPAATTTADDVARAIVQAVASVEDLDRPVLAGVMSAAGIPAALRSAGRRVAAYSYPESAARALGRAAERAEWLRRPAGTVPARAGIDRRGGEELARELLAGEDDVWLEPDATRRLLELYGIPLVPERIAETPAAAVAAARALGLPAVVKTAAAGTHKTETGGVALDLADDAAVREAAERIGCPVVVQPMVRGGPELLAGIAQDPVFGPLVAFGPGGVLAELIGEAGFRIAPLTDADAEELVLAGKAGRLVRGFRGAPAADPHALVDLLLRLSQLGSDLPELAELDLNPVIALPDRCVAVDARVRLARTERVALAKTW